MISNFLKQRTATIQLNGTSISTSVEKGCSQGSILSPFLWNIVVDETLNLQLAPGIQIQAYADDLIITKTGLNCDDIKNCLEGAC